MLATEMRQIGASRPGAVLECLNNIPGLRCSLGFHEKKCLVFVRFHRFLTFQNQASLRALHGLTQTLCVSKLPHDCRVALIHDLKLGASMSGLTIETLLACLLRHESCRGAAHGIPGTAIQSTT